MLILISVCISVSGCLEWDGTVLGLHQWCGAYFDQRLHFCVRLLGTRSRGPRYMATTCSVWRWSAATCSPQLLMKKSPGFSKPHATSSRTCPTSAAWILKQSWKERWLILLQLVVLIWLLLVDSSPPSPPSLHSLWVGTTEGVLPSCHWKMKIAWHYYYLSPWFNLHAWLGVT